MNKIKDFIKPIAGILVVGLLIYFFSDIFLYFAIAIILSMLGRPLCESIKKFHIKKFHLGDSISSVLTMLALFLIFSLIFLIIIPLVNKEISILSEIDTDAIVEYFEKPLENIYNFLIQYNIIRPEENILNMVENKLYSIVNWDNFSSILGGVISKTSSLVIGTFSTIFLTFFLLRDPNIIHNIFMAITPDNQTLRMKSILHDSRVMLTRYIFGLISEVLCMMILIFIGLSIFDIKSALIIAVIGGLMNIIPYLGPLMGCAVGVVIGIISNLGIGCYNLILPNTLEIMGVFIVANLIDNFVLQPTIYSKSVFAHPIEIFLVILMAGNIGGVVGMIIAIPSYTLIRIVAKQLLSEFKFIELLTKKLEVKENKD
ncbi:MAG: AI-2E family transporter [Bacteroidales bacterium]|jgi:predicted PurR-regulated permease PerM|nr:AI-2E family transporter [Bacteroidales bacterium]